ncbi:MAG: hypothetical protein AAF756_22610 [Pseudomonadota bacterium]
MRPMIWHLAVSALFAALAPAVYFGLLSSSLTVIPFAFCVALIHAVVLGLPIAVALWRKDRITVWTSLVFGIVIGCAAAAVLTWPLGLSGLKSNASVNGVSTIINGVPTIAGWIGYGKGIAFSGQFGAIGGLAFWCSLRLLKAYPPNSADGKVSFLSAKSGFVGSLAIVTAAVVLLIPTATNNRSCHNVLRDGRTAISPVLSIDLEIQGHEWPELVQLYVGVADVHSMQFRNSSESRPRVVNLLYLSACKEDFAITTNEQRWSRDDWKSPLPGYGVGIRVYEVHSGSDWPEVAMDLTDRLERKWPGKVRYRDNQGYFVPKPSIIAQD